jgi:hypothetical protein
MLTLTPVVCVLSAIAFSECFSYCLQDEKEKPSSQRARVNSADGSVDSSTDSEENSQNGPEKNNKNLYDKVIDLSFNLNYYVISNRIDFRLLKRQEKLGK